MNSKTPKSIVFCLALLAATALGTPQKPSAISLLPAPNWSLVNSQTLGLDAVRGWNGDPAIEREYGVQSLERRTYTLLSAGKSVDVMMENAPDPSAAYGLLTYYQTESMVPERELGLAMRSQDGTLMARGRTFIRIAKPSGIGSDAVREGVAGRPARPEGFELSPAELRALLTAVGTLKTSAGTSQTYAGLPAAPLAAGDGGKAVCPRPSVPSRLYLQQVD